MLFHQIRAFRKNDSTFWQKFLVGPLKTAFYLSIGTFWVERIVFEDFEGLSNLLRQWAKNFCLFVKTFARVVRTTVFLSKGTLCNFFLKMKEIYEFSIFSDNQRKTLVFLLKVFQRGCKNCILRVNRNIFSRYASPGKMLHHFRTRETVFLKKLNVFFTIFGHWGSNIQVCGKLFWMRPWKLPSTCPKDFFGAKDLILKLFRPSPTLSQNFLSFCQNFRQSCQNCILLVHKNPL